MKRYIFKVNKGEKELGIFEVDSETELTSTDGTRTLLSLISKDENTGLFYWEGNILDKSDLKETTVTLLTIYVI